MIELIDEILTLYISNGSVNLKIKTNILKAKHKKQQISANMQK